jgi:hypothetical protein
MCDECQRTLQIYYRLVPVQFGRLKYEIITARMANRTILFTLQTRKIYYLKLQLYLSRVGVKLTISL